MKHASIKNLNFNSQGRYDQYRISSCYFHVLFLYGQSYGEKQTYHTKTLRKQGEVSYFIFPEKAYHTYYQFRHSSMISGAYYHYHLIQQIQVSNNVNVFQSIIDIYNFSESHTQGYKIVAFKMTGVSSTKTESLGKTFYKCLLLTLNKQCL